MLPIMLDWIYKQWMRVIKNKGEFIENMEWVKSYGNQIQ